MTLYWFIKMMNAVFVISMGVTVLWLFSHALAYDKVTQKVNQYIGPFFLIIMRDNVPYLKMPLDKKHYLIGRDAACDIVLKGNGIHPMAAEVCINDGHYIFRNISTGNELTGELLKGKDKIEKLNMTIGNYLLCIEALKVKE